MMAFPQPAAAVVAVVAGPLVLSPAQAEFGFVSVGAAGLVTLTAKNAGATTVIVQRVRLTSPPFSVESDFCLDKSLRPNEGCEITVRFLPTMSGPFSAVLEIDTNAGTSIAALTGSGFGGVTGGSTGGVTTGPVTTGVTGGTTPATTRPLAVTTTLPRPATTAPDQTTQPSVTRSTTPSASTPTTSGQGPRLVGDDERLRECERQAQDATVSYEPTRKMRMGETQQVRVTAAVGEPPRTSVPGSPGASTTLVPVTLRCEVQAQLRGEDFTVEPEGFQQASFLDRPAVTWSWDVVPIRSGPRLLTLEIRSIAEIQGRRIEGAGGELFTTAIDVGVKRENVGQKLTRWSGVVVDHPLVKGFGSLAVVVGAGLSAWRWLLGRRWPWSRDTGAAP